MYSAYLLKYGINLTLQAGVTNPNVKNDNYKINGLRCVFWLVGPIKTAVGPF